MLKLTEALDGHFGALKGCGGGGWLLCNLLAYNRVVVGLSYDHLLLLLLLLLLDEVVVDLMVMVGWVFEEGLLHGEGGLHLQLLLLVAARVRLCERLARLDGAVFFERLRLVVVVDGVLV